MEKRCFLAFCPSIPDLWQPGWSQQFLLDWDLIAIGENWPLDFFPPPFFPQDPDFSILDFLGILHPKIWSHWTLASNLISMALTHKRTSIGWWEVWNENSQWLIGLMQIQRKSNRKLQQNCFFPTEVKKWILSCALFDARSDREGYGAGS